jgi:5-methylcytosine-specific restriction enzyme subunit McrC
MEVKTPIVTYEFGTFYKKGDFHKEGEIELEESTFNNLWNFILSNKTNDDTDAIMSVQTRGRKPIIKAGRYVGTIQTKDGQTIEILPKLYKIGGKQDKDVRDCRKVFLYMLKHFTDSKTLSIQDATLNTKENFPIIEVYIGNYISSVEQLLLGGLKKNYSIIEENQVFLKGKLDIQKQLTKNAVNKARFAIRYNKFIENIPQNRIIVTTLKKLLYVSHNVSNKARITSLLTIMSDIPSCSNIEQDLKIVSTKNRLFSSYDLIMQWSTQFLLNRGFTNFSGDSVNQALLFKAEKIFEDFIAYLFKRYATSYNVDAQNTRYFLVDRHNEGKMFNMRPDILLETNPDSPYHECVIIDTKWKIIDSKNIKNDYNLDIKDMYQLYAYGQKYRIGETKRNGYEVIPKLVLIYPYSDHFSETLPEFVYDDIDGGSGLKLLVMPFNLAEHKTYRQQIENIIQRIKNETSDNRQQDLSAN